MCTPVCVCVCVCSEAAVCCIDGLFGVRDIFDVAGHKEMGRDTQALCASDLV
jgi:hypothetical protein